MHASLRPTQYAMTFRMVHSAVRYDVTIVIYSESKEAVDMYNNILLFESILGTELFEKEVEVLLTDRGSEFTMAEEIEKREDG